MASSRAWALPPYPPWLQPSDGPPPTLVRRHPYSTLPASTIPRVTSGRGRSDPIAMQPFLLGSDVIWFYTTVFPWASRKCWGCCGVVRMNGNFTPVELLNGIGIW